MGKKKIILFTENLYGGGVERIQQIICSHFDFTRYELTVFSLREEKHNDSYYPKEITFKYIYDVLKRDDSIGTKLMKIIKNKTKLWVYGHFSPYVFYKLFIRERSDVVIAFIEGYATRMVAGFPKEIKKIAWLHIELQNYHWSEIAYHGKNDEEKAYLSMNHIPCVSQEVKRQLEILYPKVKSGLVLYNPVDTLMISNYSLAPLPKQFERKVGKKRIISIGSLNERKGHFRLLNAFHRLIKDGFTIELLILGRGELFNKLHSLIKDKDMEGMVYLLGYQENPYNYLASSDIYVCSSYAEGYNTAITESLVLGKAVVSTECSGVKEQLGENNEWGICVPNSEEGIYQGLKEMLKEKTLMHYTEQALIRGKEFTLEESMKNIYTLIYE
jgi:glycosyltransferase involved in cell wall biosynthesis